MGYSQLRTVLARPGVSILTPVLALALLAGALAAPSAADPKRFYLGNDDHTDYMWSGDETQYRAAFLNMLDFYMAQSEATATNPVDSRGRFNCDGNLWVWEYEHNKTPAEFNRLIGHIRAGDISMPLNAAVICYGAMPAEAVLRSMYYAGRLERRQNLRFPLVAAMENQTLPGGLASLWAGSGALYSWRGVCGCASRTDWGNRPREIYNYRGPDGTGVCLRWATRRSTAVGAVGGYDESWQPTSQVSFEDSDPTYLSHWPWDVNAAFGFGGDALQTTTDSLVRASLTLSNANRRVIVSNEKDFFEDFLAHHANEIPTFSGSFGNEWELYASSMGELTASMRREMEKLRTAEALATVASLLNPNFMTGRETARDQAFMSAGLYYEHDWTADGVISKAARAQWERDQYAKVAGYVDTLYANGLAAVAAGVRKPAGVERHVVFNPLSWSRTDFADLIVARGAPLKVIDVATGQEVPSQVMGPSGSGTRVRIIAANVPSVGYRVYEVQAGAGASFPASATITLPKIDNGIYGVTLGPRGSILSLIDHRHANKELVLPGGTLHELWTGGGTVTVESSGPVSTTLRVVAGGSPTHETRVTLYAGIDRVDVEGLVTQNFGQSVGYDSQFDLSGATLRHEEVGMIAKVARAAQGGDYADQNARTDYLSFGHFLDFSRPDIGVTVSNWDSPFFKAGNSTTTVLDGTTPSFEAVVGMQVDGTTFGITNQGGDSRFLDRFALHSHDAYDPAAAMRFALEHQNPLAEATVTGTPTSVLPPTSWSLVSMPSPDVLLWTLKPAEEGIGQGVIARVWNLADADRTLSLSLPPVGISDARRATHIETDLGPAVAGGDVLQETLARQQMKTFRLTPRHTPGVSAQILSPADHAFFYSGNPISLSGLAAGSANATLHWEVDRIDDSASTPNRFAFDGAQASFTPEAQNPGSVLRYAIRLIANDGAGTIDTARVTIDPEVDLSPSSAISIPDPGSSVDPSTYRFTLRNLGHMAVPHATWTLRGDGSTLASGDTAIAANDSVLVERRLGPSFAVGNHSLRVVADSAAALRESNETNNAATRTLAILGPPDRSPPIFTRGPTATPSVFDVTITWGTSEPARGAVRFGLTPAPTDSASFARDTSESVKLQNLARGTRYYYRVAASDDSLNTALSPPDSFTTLPNRAPTAVASGSPSTGSAPLAVTFSSTGSSDPDGDALTYSWAFGDGGTANGASASHTYAGAGGYVAVLTVNDGHGGTAQANVPITASASQAFPATPVLDNFNRVNGVIGTSWSGETGNFSISANTLAPKSSGWGTISWSPTVFGVEQEAYVKLTALATGGQEQDVLLKMQGVDANAAHLEIRYDHSVHVLYASTYTPGPGWQSRGSLPITMAVGDVFGARTFTNGDVALYRNGTKLATYSIASWSYASATGRIGLTVGAASASRLDDFGGGNVPSVDLTPPAFTSGPTSTPGRGTATIQWTTNESSRAAVRYGVTPAYGDSVTTSFGLSSTASLANLLRGKRYYYRVAVTDAAANTALSPPDSLTTLPNRSPVAGAGAVPLSGPAPLAVQFSGASSSDPDGDPLTYQWRFGDGALASGSSVAHTYAPPGVYPVTLTVADAFGGADSTTLSVNAANSAPHATLVTPVAPAFFASGADVNLYGAGSDAQDSAAFLNYRWEVDRWDGASNEPNHLILRGQGAAFTAEPAWGSGPLHYDVRLIVTDSGTLSDTARVRIDAEIDVAAGPIIAIPDPGVAGDPISLRFRIYERGRMPVTHASWSAKVDGVQVAFGDTAIAGSDSVDVTRALPSSLSAGSHAVSVDVAGGIETNLANNSIGRALTVAGAPDRTPPVFTSLPAATPTLGGVTVIRWTTNEPTTGVLRFGTGPAPSDSVTDPINTSHVATLSGLLGGIIYRFQVGAADTAGNVANAPPDSFVVPINHNPIAIASGVPIAATSLTVQFSSIGTGDPDGDPLAYLWKFGDTTSDTARNARHAYPAAGSYSAWLIVSDNHGGRDSAFVPISVISTLAFPSALVLDNFERANGSVGAGWGGNTSAFAIRTRVLAPIASGSQLLLRTSVIYGVEQEAFVTLSTISTSSNEHGVLLKAQGTTSTSARLEVRYDAQSRRIRVSTYTPGTGWRDWLILNQSLVTRDRLGARTLATGDVEVYRNSTRIAVVSISGWSFASSGGYIGLAVNNATSARFDDFGGGTIAPRPAVLSAAIESGPPSSPSLPARPDEIRLSPPMPNPARDRVAFDLELPTDARVTWSVYDLAGRALWNESRDRAAGPMRLEWDCRASSGGLAPAGIYLARVTVGGATFMRRFVLIR